MEMPNYLDYEKINRMDPWSNYQAGQQIDLARMYQQNEQQKQLGDIKAKGLANMYEEQAMPTRLAQGQATLEQTLQGNRKSRVEADIAENTYPLSLEEKKKKLILDASQHDLDQFFVGAQKMANDPDPRIRQQGLSALMMHKDFIKMREEHKNTMEKTTAENLSREKIASGHDATTREVANIRATAQAANRKTVEGMDAELREAKGNALALSVVFNKYAQKAATEGNIEVAQTLAQQAQYYLAMGERQHGAATAAGQANKPDPNAFGIPTVPATPPVPINPMFDDRGPLSKFLYPNAQGKKPLSAY